MHKLNTILYNYAACERQLHGKQTEKPLKETSAIEKLYYLHLISKNSAHNYILLNYTANTKLHSITSKKIGTVLFIIAD